MRRLTGIAAIAFAAQSGLAWAQPAIGGPEDRPRSRAERSAPDDLAPGSGERGGPQQRLERPSGAPRGAQTEDLRGEEPQRGQIQRREREQAQRERLDQLRARAHSKSSRGSGRSNANRRSANGRTIGTAAGLLIRLSRTAVHPAPRNRAAAAAGQQTKRSEYGTAGPKAGRPAAARRRSAP